MSVVHPALKQNGQKNRPQNGQRNAQPSRRLRAKTRRISRSTAGDIALMLLLAAFAAFMALPLVYTISTAFKPIDELFLYPPRFFAIHPTLRNFTDLIISLRSSFIPFTRYLFNSVLVTVLATVGHIVLSAMCAYPLAKHRFRYRNAIFQMIVLSLMFSPFVIGIPRYMIMHQIRILDSYWALLLPAMSSSLGLYLLKQFMEQVPDSILESARIDGAKEMRILWSVVMPTVKPAWLTLILLSVNATWNDAYSGALYLHNEALKPMSVVQAYLMSAGFMRAGALAAFMLIMLVLPIGTFILSQSNVIETMKSSGIKE